jgi:hypothetical protein
MAGNNIDPLQREFVTLCLIIVDFTKNEGEGGGGV